MIIQIIGLPKSGKTMIAEALSDRINAVHLTDQEVRGTVIPDLDPASIEYSKRFGELARLIERRQEQPVVVDFDCNTDAHRRAFGKPDILVWLNTVDNPGVVWENPTTHDHEILVTGDDYWDALPTRAFGIITAFKLFDWKADTNVIFGSFQDLDFSKVEEMNLEQQTVLGVLHTSGMTENDKLFYREIKNKIISDLPGVHALKVPNFKSIDHAGENNG